MCGKGHIISVLNILGSKKTKKLTTDTSKPQQLQSICHQDPGH